MVFIPYCGAAPVPGTDRWNLDPVLISALLLGLVFYLAMAKRLRFGGRDAAYFFAGWAMLALAFLSPLCNLSVALFSARVAQHMALALIAAPLLARGLTVPKRSSSSPSREALPWVATLAFAVALWVWHSPIPYDETLRNNAVYWLMHITTIAAALALWIAIFRSNGATAYLVIFATGLQMSFLGALLTFASSPLFAVHEFTTSAWGLTWLQDQELGGLVMWVPAGLLLAAYSAAAFGLALRRMDAPKILQSDQLA